ncbi:thioredoxin family protein [Phenylobacterium sp. LjRoot219]|uniref:thioredoxin family protein n=1 Tax=Phenylobacterium sp. LjRoot219 TaxID=3342283 RepID=UPI003ECE5D9E
MSMIRRSVLSAVVAFSFAPALPARAAPAVGQPAPAFTATDANGRTVSLAEFKGKTVVLEWTNEGCPYVKKHYNSGAMQNLQKSATADGVVWLTVVSSAPNAQGYLAPDAAKGWKTKNNAASTALLIDSSGAVGKAYDARTTPHMFIVDKSGKLAYMGGIDDKPIADSASLNGANNYVSAALGDLQAGRAVATPVTKAYGCSVKYAG